MLVGCGTGRPSAFSPSMWKRIASRISASTAGTVSPVATQPVGWVERSETHHRLASPL